MSRREAELPPIEPTVATMALQLRRVRDFPAVFGRLIDLVQYQLPQTLRSYGDVPTRFERATNIAFRYLRTTCLFVGIAFTVSIWWIPSFLHIETTLGRPQRIITIASLLLVTWVLSKMIRFYDEPS